MRSYCEEATEGEQKSMDEESGRIKKRKSDPKGIDDQSHSCVLKIQLK